MGKKRKSTYSATNIFDRENFSGGNPGSPESPFPGIPLNKRAKLSPPNSPLSSPPVPVKAKSFPQGIAPSTPRTGTPKGSSRTTPRRVLSPQSPPQSPPMPSSVTPRSPLSRCLFDFSPVSTPSTPSTPKYPTGLPIGCPPSASRRLFTPTTSEPRNADSKKEASSLKTSVLDDQPSSQPQEGPETIPDDILDIVFDPSLDLETSSASSKDEESSKEKESGLGFQPLSFFDGKGEILTSLVAQRKALFESLASRPPSVPVSQVACSPVNLSRSVTARTLDVPNLRHRPLISTTRHPSFVPKSLEGQQSLSQSTKVCVGSRGERDSSKDRPINQLDQNKSVSDFKKDLENLFAEGKLRSRTFPPPKTEKPSIQTTDPVSVPELLPPPPPPPNPENQEKTSRKFIRARLELYETERSYCRTLDTIISEYYKPLCRALPERYIRTLFGNIVELHHLSSRLCEELIHWVGDPQNVSLMSVFESTFKELHSAMLVYCDHYEYSFLKNWPHFINPLRSNFKKVSTTFCTFFKQRELQPQVLESMLIVPVQRIPRYRLLLQEICDNTENVSENQKKDLFDVFAVMESLASELNSTLGRLNLLHEGQEAAQVFARRFDNGSDFESQLENEFSSIQLEINVSVLELVSKHPKRVVENDVVVFKDQGCEFERTQEQICLFGSRLIRVRNGDSFLRRSRNISQVLNMEFVFDFIDPQLPTCLHLVSPFFGLSLVFSSLAELEACQESFRLLKEKMTTSKPSLKTQRAIYLTQIAHHTFQSVVCGGDPQAFKPFCFFWIDTSDEDEKSNPMFRKGPSHLTPKTNSYSSKTSECSGYGKGQP